MSPVPEGGNRPSVQSSGAAGARWAAGWNDSGANLRRRASHRSHRLDQAFPLTYSEVPGAQPSERERYAFRIAPAIAPATAPKSPPTPSPSWIAAASSAVPILYLS